MAPILVDSRIRLSYGHYYLSALPGRVRLTARGFGGLRHIDPFRTLLPMVVEGRRVVIDLGDSPEINPDVLAWADVYGKVNPTPQQVAEGVMAIGPGFGIRPDSWQGLWHTLTTPMPMEGLRAGLAERRNLWLRAAPLTRFHPGSVESDYIFSVNSLWEWEQTQSTTNRWRAAWMRNARENPQVRFEGGFVSRPNSELGPPQGPQEQEFADLILPSRIGIADWIKRTQRSFAVFNTPAVYECHGWKLGQYLAMGKAVVSTPLSRELPAPLRHGEHLHVVQSQGELQPAMDRLRSDVAYRERLQRNAHQYWLDHLRPAKVVQRLISTAAN